jgi:hypothetical protein
LSNTEIFFVATFGAIYLALVLTLAVNTFQKGYTWLFALGFLLPLLWLIGALRKPKPGSKAAHRESEHWRTHG